MVEWTSVATYRRVMEVNFFGLVAMTRALLPLLRRARGRVVNLSSMLGRIAIPSASAYCASKHAVEAFSDSLRREVWPFGVHVVLVEPGFARTPINEGTAASVRAAYDSAPASVRAAYGDALVATAPASVAALMKDALDPVVVVDRLVQAVQLECPPARYLIGNDAWALATLNMLPAWLGDWVAAHTPAAWTVLPTEAIYRFRW
jgi:NAD(P)-dependent dehydrogenase (short-subunit alcohol dehydrogenase family)